jgi:hypothetical protein
MRASCTPFSFNTFCRLSTISVTLLGANDFVFVIFKFRKATRSYSGLACITHLFPLDRELNLLAQIPEPLANPPCSFKGFNEIEIMMNSGHSRHHGRKNLSLPSSTWEITCYTYTVTTHEGEQPHDGAPS